jgi:hypothetical protein
MRPRDELWFKGREWVQDKSCSMPQDEALIAELTTLAFEAVGGLPMPRVTTFNVHNRYYPPQKPARIRLIVFRGIIPTSRIKLTGPLVPARRKQKQPRSRPGHSKDAVRRVYQARQERCPVYLALTKALPVATSLDVKRS